MTDCGPTGATTNHFFTEIPALLLLGGVVDDIWCSQIRHSRVYGVTKMSCFFFSLQLIHGRQGLCVRGWIDA